MPYILNKTNGSVLTVVADASVDITTNLTFIGRNYSGYGEVFNENFLRLLENFSNSTPPTRPVLGQLWYNSFTKRLNFCHNSASFKSLANIYVQSSDPSFSVSGDLWWDTSNLQLKAFDGSAYQVIGPQVSSAAKSSWESAEETSVEDVNTKIPFIKGKIGPYPIVTVSSAEFTPIGTSNLSGVFPYVKKGITLLGANKITGSSTSSGYYFWGTAAESLTAFTATSVTVTKDESTNNNFYLPFVSTATTGPRSVFASGAISFNPSTSVLNTISSSARYADLAERYASDSPYRVGTVLVLGGTKEVTVTDQHANTSVVGVVSTNPGYMLNSEAGNDHTHPYIALKGRVPCKVVGSIRKGELLVTSSKSGYAEAFSSGDDPNSVFAKAIEDFNGTEGVIEVLVI